jgi:sRNA-binding regulator protein Hfq
MVFVMYDGILRGLILRSMPYNLDILTDGNKVRINKLDIKYWYKRSHESLVLPHIDYDEEVRSLDLSAEMIPGKRYQIDDKVLVQCYREHRPILMVLRGGEMVGGVIDWFSKYEVKVELPSRRCVICCRHAAYSLGIAV